MGKRHGRYCQEAPEPSRDQKWRDKQNTKAQLGTALKDKPFGAASHAKGIVLEEGGVEAKLNSAIVKCVKVQLIKKITAFIAKDGCSNFIEKNDEVLVAGFGCKGHAIGDIPGVRFKVIKVANVSFWLYTKARRQDQDNSF